MTTKTGLEAPKEIGKRATLGLEDLHPNPANRNLSRDEDIKALAQSIRAIGLLHPLIVRPHPEKEGCFRIIAGERRWRALKHLRMETAPCIIVKPEEGSNDAEMIGVVENHQRRPLTTLEGAAAVRGLLDLGLEAEAVARSLGRSRSWVARRSSLTELSERWLAQIADPASKIASWPASHLEMVSRFPQEVQDRMLEDWRGQLQWQIPSLRDLLELTAEYLHLLSTAPWKPEDDTLCPEAGACAVCPKRSSHHPDLFEDELLENGKAAKDDRCLDPAC